jgi:hypothetical protein
VNQTGDLPTCSIVPQPTTVLRAAQNNLEYAKTHLSLRRVWFIIGVRDQHECLALPHAHRTVPSGMIGKAQHAYRTPRVWIKCASSLLMRCFGFTPFINTLYHGFRCQSDDRFPELWSYSIYLHPSRSVLLKWVLENGAWRCELEFIWLFYNSLSSVLVTVTSTFIFSLLRNIGERL